MSNLVNHARFIRAQEHEDIKYLKQDEIGVVIAEALSELYLAKPSNPVHFLGNWLLNYAATLKHKEQEYVRSEQKESLIQKHEQALQDEHDVEEKERREKSLKKSKEDEFADSIVSSLDVDDILKEFINFIKKSASATAAYAGILEKIKRPVKDTDEELAHIDEEAPWHVRYIEASEGSEFMIGQTLKQDEGEITYSIWKEPEIDEAASDAEEGKEEKTTMPYKLNAKYVPDVINETKLKFFDVPKLGSYFVIPLTYKSCLSELSFDAALEDALECRRQRADQEQEKINHEQASVKDEEEKVYEEIVEAPYKTNDIKLLVALDTLGQDKELPKEIQEKCVDWVIFYKNEWERAEAQSLKKDITAYLPIYDRNKELYNDKQLEWAEEERVATDEATKILDPACHDDIKHLAESKALLEVVRKRILDPTILKELFNFKDFKVIKHPRVFQLVFYYFEVEKEKVVSPGTNQLNWKIAKQNLNEFFENNLRNINPCGQKPRKPPAYARTLKLDKDIKQINSENVRLYSLALYLLHRFLELCIRVRILDVTVRRRDYMTKRDEREAAIKASDDLSTKKMQALEEARDKFNKEQDLLDEFAERSVFDESRFLQEFEELESNRPIDIPAEVSPDEDGDLEWEETNP